MWEKLINDYIKELNQSDELVEYGEWFEPYSKALAKSAKEKKITQNPATPKQIEKREKSLNCTLPPSYRKFLLYSNGLLMPNRFFNLLPVEEIDWFYNYNKEWIDIWIENDTNCNENYIAIKDQDPCTICSKYLKSALQISDSSEGEVLLLVPEVKNGKEWEAWYFANYLAGAYRFSSFEEMMKFFIYPPKTKEISTKDLEAMQEKALQKLYQDIEPIKAKITKSNTLLKAFKEELDLVLDEIPQKMYEKTADKESIKQEILDFLYKKD